MNFLSQVDTSVFLFLNQPLSTIFDFLFYWISNPFIWVPLYIFICIIIIKQRKKKSIIILSFLLISFVGCDQSCNFLKKNIKRIRPCHETVLSDKIHLVKNCDGNLYKGGLYGFPSGHAANSFYFFLFFLFFLKNKSKIAIILMLFWTLLLSYSRIYLGVHYPFDILAGWLLGTFWAFITFLILKIKAFKLFDIKES